MIHRMIKDRLEKDAGHSLEERRKLFREIVQEVAIYSLSAAGFFESAVFHGGTELRIVHSLPRFSEDLDFLLRSPDPCFSWTEYRERLLTPERSLQSRRLKLYNLAGAKFTDSPVESLQ